MSAVDAKSRISVTVKNFLLVVVIFYSQFHDDDVRYACVVLIPNSYLKINVYFDASLFKFFNTAV